jgi:organic hydroperoxide reductase OsmC/OhrA
MQKEHHYALKITWTGNKGTGTSHYSAYERKHLIEIINKEAIEASSDTPFRGDGSKHNPEDFLLASLSSCHMLWYLHLCADAGIIVIAYTDEPSGTLSLHENGSGSFTNVILKPKITVKNKEMVENAKLLHDKANRMCFIANSINFKVHHQPEILVAE